MHGSRWAVSLLAYVALLVASGCHDAKKELATRAAAELATLKTEAGKACRCEQHGGPGAKKTCWASFDATMAKKHATPSGTTCLPVYQEGRCWHAKEQRPSSAAADGCITIEYHAVLYDFSEVPLCTAREAKDAEATWYQAAQESLDAGNRTDAPHAKRDAADAGIRRIARGEAVMATHKDMPSCI